MIIATSGFGERKEEITQVFSVILASVHKRSATPTKDEETDMVLLDEENQPIEYCQWHHPFSTNVTLLDSSGDKGADKEFFTILVVPEGYQG